MPPKAEKKEKPVKGDEAEQIILEYLRSVNRPYASTDVSTNLKGKVTKPEAQKALTSLAGKGVLTMKPNGKQTIFVYNQSQLPVPDAEEMAQIDESLKTIKASLEEKKKELKTLSSDLAATESLPKTGELAAEIERVSTSNDMTTQALKALRGEDAAPPMSMEDTAKVDREWTTWRKEWVSRRKVYNVLFGMIQDCGLCNGTRSDFEEDQGIVHEETEAKEVEAGEFCQQAKLRVPAKRGASLSLGSRGPCASSSIAKGGGSLGKWPKLA